ncbi:cdc42 effector protein 5 [Denticeps clupeoides]|uniref:CRIB domain-containing protein n=1 Tax=Denticeps clupeoides TaxID=299321 RepID=A0AAY4A8D2_9TELE|nr:cdc42 effector protein 5 [Denticeps clupeoides]
MPLHKTSRAPRLDPTMISAPLGDFRHTMHIGRGGDVFGDTSFLSSHGPAPLDASKPATPVQTPSTESEPLANHSSPATDSPTKEAPRSGELRHAESVSSFDLDLDLGPSMLGDVLGVMDGLILDSKWTAGDGDEEVVSSRKSAVEMPAGESHVRARNEVNEKKTLGSVNGEEKEVTNEEGGLKIKGFKPKVRFSEKREEIIGRQESGEGFESEGEEAECPVSPKLEKGPLTEPTFYRPDSPPRATSLLSSNSLDGSAERDSETDSEEEGVEEQGYSFEDDSDDEIGL